MQWSMYHTLLYKHNLLKSTLSLNWKYGFVDLPWIHSLWLITKHCRWTHNLNNATESRIIEYLTISVNVFSFPLFVSFLRYNRRRTLGTWNYWIQTEFLGSSSNLLADWTTNVVQKVCRGVNNAESHFSRLILSWWRRLEYVSERTGQESLWSIRGMCISIS